MNPQPHGVTNVAEIESLFRRRDAKTAVKKTELPFLVTEGTEFMGGDDPKDQIERNSMGRYVHYYGTKGRLEILHKERSMEAYHPLHNTDTEIGMTYPITWEAGTWLLHEVLRNGADGNARIPPRQEGMRHVFTQKCRDLVSRLPAPPAPPTADDPPGSSESRRELTEKILDALQSAWDFAQEHAPDVLEWAREIANWLQGVFHWTAERVQQVGRRRRRQAITAGTVAILLATLAPTAEGQLSRSQAQEAARWFDSMGNCQNPDHNI